MQIRTATTFIVITVLAAGLFFCPLIYAQDQADQYVPLGPDDLQQLAAPIALYPDAILAQVLVACTYPDDVIAAVRWEDAGNNLAGIDDQDWDLSVKGVARFPDVLHYLANNIDWTNDLGDAFLNQQDDVMDAIQALRGQAMAAGSLVSNDQQQVVVMGSTIEIIPTDPQTIYVPQYDPQVVYVEPTYDPGAVIVPRIRFGRPIPCGPWLHHDFDWDDRAIYVGDWGVNRPWWKRDPHGGRFDYTHDRPGLFHPADHITINVHNRVTNVPAGQWSRKIHDPHKPMPKFEPHPGGHLPDAQPGHGYPPKAKLTQGKRDVKQESGPLNYGSGPAAARASDRGRDSRQKEDAHPDVHPAARPAQVGPMPGPNKSEPKPVEEKPKEEKPTEPARHALPASSPHLVDSPKPAAKPEPAAHPEPSAKPTPAPAAKPAPAPAARPPAPAARAEPAPKPAPPPPSQSRGNEPSHGGAASGYQNGSQTAADSQRGAASRGEARKGK